MLQVGGDAALAQKPRAEPRIVADRGIEHPERNRAPLAVACEIHRPGGALSEERINPVPGDLSAGREHAHHARPILRQARTHVAGSQRRAG
jgi:hypothetical protein